MKVFRTVLFAVSAALNAFFLILFVVANSPPPGGSVPQFSFYLPEQNDAYAFIAALPRENASASFGTMEISLKKGQACYLQYSFFNGSGQFNTAFGPLYNHNIVSVERSAYGLSVRALAPGRCLLQSVSNDGFFTIAVITVEDF